MLTLNSMKVTSEGIITKVNTTIEKITLSIYTEIVITIMMMVPRVRLFN